MNDAQSDSVLHGVRSVLRKVAGKRYSGEFSPGTRLIDDLGLDSVDAIRIMLELERAFSIDVAAKSESINVAEITTVDDLVGLVRRLA